MTLKYLQNIHQPFHEFNLKRFANDHSDTAFKPLRTIRYKRDTITIKKRNTELRRKIRVHYFVCYLKFLNSLNHNYI